MEHFFEDIPGYFWFRQGYKQMLNVLPPSEPSTFVEIGSFHGKSLAFLAVEAINRKIPVTIHSVESFAGWPGVPQGDELRTAFDAYTEPIRRVLNGRFKLWDMPSLDAAPQFADDSCDVVWIDGDHSYESCLADIRAWWPKLKPGGYMGGDDWFMEGVQKAVGEEFAPNYMLGHGLARQPKPVYWPWWIVRKSPADIAHPVLVKP